MNPTEPNIPQSTQPTATTAKLQTVLNYTTKSIGIGDSSGLLEWTYDDRIRLFELDRNDPNKSTPVFDILPSEIKKVKGLSSYLTFYLHNGKYYNFMFSDTAMLTFGVVGGLVGGVASDLIANKAGLKDWRAQLNQFGVVDQSMSMSKLLGKTALWILVGIGILIVISIIGYVVSQA